MAPASYFSITSKISAVNNLYFTYISEQIDFPGWKIVTKKYDEQNSEYKYLCSIRQNDIMNYKKIISKIKKFKFTETKTSLKNTLYWFKKYHKLIA